MKRRHRLAAGSLIAGACLLGMVCRAQDAAPEQAGAARGAPTAEKLGWRLSVQAWSFNRFTFFEAIDKVASLGLTCIEMFPGQALSPEMQEVKTGPGMSAEGRAALDAKLAETGVKVVSYGVTGIPGDEAGARALFSWAKGMGIEVINTEPDPGQLEAIDALCAEYGIKVGLHNHPKPSRYWDPEVVLSAVDGRTPAIGACADTGHWMRSGLDPVECLKKLEGRIVTFHFKDLNAVGGGAHDVPWGTGAGDVPAMLREIRRQGLKAIFSIEYEHNWDRSLPEIAACVRNFERMAREIAIEEQAWVPLFDGSNLDAWQRGNGQPPAPGWAIEGDELAMKGKGGYIWSRDRFADFFLELEFNTQGNSGLFFRTDNPGDPVQTGIEMQVYTPESEGKHGVGAIYDLQAPSKKAGREGWNSVRLTAVDNRITVTLNGEGIIDMDVDEWSEAGKNPDGSGNKFKRALKDFVRDGHIGFQDHGAPVRYRNIRIKSLPR